MGFLRSLFEVPEIEGFPLLIWQDRNRGVVVPFSFLFIWDLHHIHSVSNDAQSEADEPGGVSAGQGDTLAMSTDVEMLRRPAPLRSLLNIQHFLNNPRHRWDVEGVEWDWGGNMAAGWSGS